MLTQFVYICEGFTGCVREHYEGIDKATMHQPMRNANAPHYFIELRRDGAAFVVAELNSQQKSARLSSIEHIVKVE
jgi:hypothetical protein